MLSRFIGGMISTGLGNILSMVLNLFGTVIAARYLPEEAFGAFILLQVVAGFLTQVSSFGLNISLAKFITSTEEKQHKRELINTAVLFRLFTIFIVSCVALIFKHTLATFFNSSLLLELAIFVPPLFMLESSKGLLISVLQGFFLFKRIGITYFIDSLVNLLFIVVFVLVLDRGVFGLIYARLISLSLSGAFAYFATPIKKQLVLNIKLLKEVLLFGFPLQINDILTFVFRRVDTLVIGALLGPTEIAYYEIARKIPDNLGKLFEAFRSVFFPFISKLHALGDKKRLALVINNSMRFVSFATVFSTLIVLLFGSDIVRLLFSEKYLPSVSTFGILMIGLSISLVSYTIGTSLVAIGESDKPVIINSVHSVVSLVGNLILIPIFGIIGAAFSSLAGNSISNPLNVLFLRRKKVNVKVLNYLKPLFVFSICVLLILLLDPTTLLLKLVIILLFTLFCGFLSVITIEDLSALWREVRPIMVSQFRLPHSRDTTT